MVKKYIVGLSAEERAYLEQFTTTGRRAADRITRAGVWQRSDTVGQSIREKLKPRVCFKTTATS